MTRVAYKRVVIGLNQSAPDRATLRSAAELAGLLRIDLFGLFIEDPGMMGFAGLPGAREYQVLGRRWQRLDPESMARQVDLCARSARRLIDETARGLGVASSFEIVRSAIGEAFDAVSSASDIVIIAAPRNPSQRAVAPFPQLLHAAFKSAATVFYVPPRIVRTRGPVAAVAMAPDDPSIGAATAIALAAKEGVVVIEAYRGDMYADAHAHPAETPIRGDVPIARLRIAPQALLDQRSLCSALSGLGERMIVVTRGAFGTGDGDRPADLAALCGVPLLLVEADAAPRDPEASIPGRRPGGAVQETDLT